MIAKRAKPSEGTAVRLRSANTLRPPPRTMAWRLKIPRDLPRAVALKYLDTGNVSFSTTALPNSGARVDPDARQRPTVDILLNIENSSAPATIDARRWTRILNHYREPSWARSVAEVTITVLPLVALWSMARFAFSLGHWWASLLMTMPIIASRRCCAIVPSSAQSAGSRCARASGACSWRCGMKVNTA